MWNLKLKTLDYFPCVPVHDLKHLGPVSQNCPNTEYLETGIAQPTESPETRVKSHLMWNKELKTLDYFSCVPAHDLGYSDPVSWICTNTWVPVKQNHWVAPRSTQPFILPRSVKWVPVISGNLVVKSKLPPRSGCSLDAVEPHP